MDDVSDRRQIRKAERDAKAKAERFRSTLAWIMSTKQGRELMHDLLEKCHIGRTPFARDPHTTAFLCGEQNIGMQFWSDLQMACPDLYIMMMGEASERSNADSRTRGPDGDHAISGRDDSSPGVESEYDPTLHGTDDGGDGEDGRGYDQK